jgi:hypothetical protein
MPALPPIGFATTTSSEAFQVVPAGIPSRRTDPVPAPH